MHNAIWTPGAEATNAVIRVGECRGFVVEGGLRRYVITAAHCLPRLPPAPGVSLIDERTYKDLLAEELTDKNLLAERTYKDLLAPLGAEPSVWAECVFVDPGSDLAVLGTPNDQALFDQAEAYKALVGGVTPLPVGSVEHTAQAWVLSLKGEWFRCHVARPPLWITDAEQAIVGGMSGSPILVDGKAVGAVSESHEAHAQDWHGAEPALAECLPTWLEDELISR